MKPSVWFQLLRQLLYPPLAGFLQKQYYLQLYGRLWSKVFSIATFMNFSASSVVCALHCVMHRDLSRKQLCGFRPFVIPHGIPEPLSEDSVVI